MKTRLFAPWLGILPLFLSGCVDNHESVSVLTTDGSLGLPGAECELRNGNDTWFVTTLGSVSVHLGSEDLGVECPKDGYIPAEAMVKSSVNVGAILLNGAIESTVSGSAWTYPQLITIPMRPAFGTPVRMGADMPILGY